MLGSAILQLESDISQWVSSVAQSCPTFCDPMDCSTPGLPVHHQLPEFTQTHVHPVHDTIQPSHPGSSLLLLPPISPSIRVFSNESALRMRWPEYWSFNFSIISSGTICQFSSVAQSCLTICDPMDCSMPGLPVHHQLPEFTQTHVHWVCDTIQPSQPLSAPSPTFYLSGTIHIHTLCGGTPWSKHWTELYLQCSQHLVLLKAIKCHRVETSLIFP